MNDIQQLVAFIEKEMEEALQEAAVPQRPGSNMHPNSHDYQGHKTVHLLTLGRARGLAVVLAEIQGWDSAEWDAFMDRFLQVMRQGMGMQPC